MTRGQEIMSTIEKHAPGGYDPHTDDMTVPFAIKLAEQDAEIERLREHADAVLSFLDELAENADPAKRRPLNPIVIGGSAKLVAQGFRAALHNQQLARRAADYPPGDDPRQEGE